MKKRGFTLIELLAVIVVLAVIALITVPLLLNVIDKAKKGAAEASALNYVDAVEKYMVLSQLDNTKIKLVPGKVYQINRSDELSFIDLIIPKVYANDDKIYLNNIITVDGKKPNKGWLTIRKNKVDNYSFVVNHFVVTKDQKAVKGDDPIEPPSGATKVMSKNGETYKAILYMDPTDVYNICNSENTTSETGKKEGCMKWYAYKDNGNGTYKWILDHNTTPLVKWSKTNTNDTNADAVREQLQIDITNWDNSLNADLITANEIAIITGKSPFSGDSKQWFYLDSNNQTKTVTTQGSSRYAWFYNNTYGCTSNGCDIDDNNKYLYDSTNKNYINGYWTSTPTLNQVLPSAWAVLRDSGLYYSGVTNKNLFGIRPVITF